MARILTKAEILGATDLAKEIVAVPEWGGDVIVRELTLGELDLIRSGMVSGKTTPLLAASELLASSLIDEQGARIFNDAELQAFIQKSPKIVQRLAAVCARLNGMGEFAVDTAEKNSVSGQSAGSPSGLPSLSAAPSPSSIEALPTQSSSSGEPSTESSPSVSATAT